MTLAELKALMGIAESDTSQDASLQLLLETALEVAKNYANAFDWSLEPLVLPSSIKLGIVRWVELTRLIKDRGGVVSESIGGMSQSFANGSNADYYDEVWSYWGGFRKKGVTFRPAIRKDFPSDRGLVVFDENIQENRILTGNPTRL
jgi:hypothetical protein